MALHILEMAHSPFCIPITRALDAFGVPVEREEIPNWDRSRIAEVTKGAYYQVPVLLDGDTVIYESGPTTQDVAHYVDKTYGDGRLFPIWASGMQEILIDYLEATLEDLAFKQVDPIYMETLDPVSAALIRRHKERKFGPGCIDQWKNDKAKLEAELETHLQRFESILSQKPFVLGDSPVYTDFLLYGILGNYTFQNWNQLPESCPQLQDWFERMESYRFS